MHLMTYCVLVTVLITFAYCKDCTTPACLNSQVWFAELYTRPVGLSIRRKRAIWPLTYGPKHVGVRVTVSNGDHWFIHKGSNNGDSLSSVITNACDMSRSWTKIAAGSVSGHTVNDFVEAKITQPYSWTGPNCQTSAKEMWKLVN